ncbi:DUF4034 domain-containing protein [Amycolatopsis rhizosphaerae]|uniref:DUF4034 domain-containing protein n=1 Tax=Amycolatopsis rhizosphaerae TaxID=2053003 RepID=UPI001FE7F06E|nr:DUF4034 domain-containing protein [Amycolatopsis rhizosphaerae]
MGILGLLFDSKRRNGAIALAKAAKERGMSIEDYVRTLTPEQIAHYLPPTKKKKRQLEKSRIKMPDVALFGLPSDEEVTSAHYVPESEVVDARDAFAAGDSRPAARLLAAVGTDWDRRAYVVGVLGDAAANDDSGLRAWQAARPGDQDPATVHAESLVRLAWQIRSGLQAENVSREQFDGFFRVLGDAQPAALAAAELAPADPTPWVTMLTVARGLQFDNDAFRDVWEQVLARDPLNHTAHTSALQYWCKKWFGSHELMWAFAEEAAPKHPKLAVLPLIAAHEAAFGGAGESVWREERVVRALDRLLPWLDGAGHDHPGTRTARAYAARTLVELGRGDEAVDQFRHLGVHADAHMWGYSTKGAREEFRKIRYLACYRATRP